MGLALESVKKYQLFTIQLTVSFYFNEYQNKEYRNIRNKVSAIMGVVLGNKDLKGVGHCGIILWSLGTFVIFPNFLRSWGLSRSATRETIRIYHVYY